MLNNGNPGEPASSSAPNVPPIERTSVIAASQSPERTPDSSGTATMAAASMASPAIHPRHVAWLEARGISGELAEKLGLASVQADGAHWLSVPYIEFGKPVNHKYRLTSEKRHRMDPDAPMTLWNHDCLLEDSDKPVVICEGEWDALTAIQCGYRAVSVPNGAPGEATDDPANAKRYEFLWRSRELLNRVKSFILATDGDAAGMALRQDLIALLGADRCSFVEYPTGTKDLNDVLTGYGEYSARDVLANAKPVPVRGLYRVSDFPDPGEAEVIPIGIPVLSEHLNITLATLTVLTGWAGQGKTSLTMAIIANLLRQGHGVVLGSFETMVRPILERKLRAAIIGCGEYQIPVTRIAETDRLIHDHFSVIAQMVGEDQEMTLEDVLDFAEIAIRRSGAKLLIIDPWNEVEHKRRKDESETEYIGRSIRQIKHFMRRLNVAVWVVAHPRTPQDGKMRLPGLYSISGSANWANKADYGLIYSRPNKETNLAEVHVTKVRMGLPGKEGTARLAYDFRSSSFVPAENPQ